jgi:hypothetical protein
VSSSNILLYSFVECRKQHQVRSNKDDSRDCRARWTRRDAILEMQMQRHTASRSVIHVPSGRSVKLYSLLLAGLQIDQNMIMKPISTAHVKGKEVGDAMMGTKFTTLDANLAATSPYLSPKASSIPPASQSPLVLK